MESACRAVATGALVLAGGCSLLNPLPYYVSYVRSSASVSFTCPEARIVVRPVPTGIRPECSRGSPPQELEGDPERLALWRAIDQRRFERCMEPVSFVVDACGETAEYTCSWPRRIECTRLQETDLKLHYVEACIGGVMARYDVCDCKWSELRKKLSPVAIARADVLRPPTLEAANDAAELACGK